MTGTPSGRSSSLAVVVLNWNNAPDTVECLESLARAGDSVTRIVVDNGSSDGSATAIRASGLADVVLVNDENLGYSGGNNVGISHALAAGFDYVAVLNNDTVVPAEMFVRLLSHLTTSTDRGAAAISPVIVYNDDPDRVWFAGGIIDRGWPRHLQAGEYDLDLGQTQETQTLTGCCILASREVWQQVGLFDPRLFVYFEDSDWSMRARRLGVRLVVATDVHLRHKVSRSFRAPATSLLGSYYFARNGMRFSLRHFPRRTPRFIKEWLLRPTLRALLRRPGATPILFTWLGAFATVNPRQRRAPRTVEAIAERRSR